jgi:ATP-binding cassette subfamily B protein
LSRVTNDIDNISQSLQQSLSQLITSLLTIAGVLIMMLALSPILAIIAIITVPLSISTMNRLARRSKQKFIAQWSHTGALNGLIEETFTGHAIVKTFGRQRSVEDRFATTNEKLYEAGFGAQFISGSIQPAMMFVGNLNYLMIAVVGGIRVASGSMGLGDVQAFIQYSRQFTQPLTQTASMMNVLQSGVASAERVFEVLDSEEESAEAEFVPSPQVQGRVAFENVSFSYNPDRPLDTFNKPKLFINPHCQNTIKAFLRWSRDAKTGKPNDAYKDFMDCVRYLLMDSPEIDIPIPYTPAVKRW